MVESTFTMQKNVFGTLKIKMYAKCFHFVDSKRQENKKPGYKNTFRSARNEIFAARPAFSIRFRASIHSKISISYGKLTPTADVFFCLRKQKIFVSSTTRHQICLWLVHLMLKRKSGTTNSFE